VPASEERQGLLLPVLTRKELNSAEAENISQAMTWLFLAPQLYHGTSNGGYVRRLRASHNLRPQLGQQARDLVGRARKAAT
jgi:hypothetical protein